MKKILIIIAAIAALYYLKPALFPNLGGSTASAFDEAGNPKVIIFTFSGCGAPCDDALNLLRSKDIAFENVDVSKSEENEQRLRRMGGGNSMPITFVGASRIDGYERTKLTTHWRRPMGWSIWMPPSAMPLKRTLMSTARPSL